MFFNISFKLIKLKKDGHLFVTPKCFTYICILIKTKVMVEQSDKFKVGDRVRATVTKNGYFQDVYYGDVVGYTKNGRVKVKSYRGIKMHAEKNVKLK